MAPPIITIVAAVTITAGESLSNGVDCTAGYLTRIIMPVDWTPANISLQISPDGVSYHDLFDFRGQELQMPVVPGTSTVAFVDQNPGVVGWIKLRSGSRDYPVVQKADRTFSFVLTA